MQSQIWTVVCETLKKQLAILSAVASGAPGAAPPICGYALLSFTPKRLTLWSFNSIFGYRTTLPCAGSGEGEFLVAPEKLKESVDSLKDGVKDVSFSVSDDGRLIFREGAKDKRGFSVRFGQLPVEDYKRIEPVAAPAHVWKGKLGDFAVPLVSMRKLARYTRSVGIAWNGNMSVASGSAVALWRMKGPTRAEASVLPIDTSEAVALLSQNDREAVIKGDGNRISVESDGCLLVSQLLTERLPDVEALLAALLEANSYEVICNREELSHALSRVRPYSESKLTENGLVELAISGSEMRLTARAQTDEAIDYCDCKNEGNVTRKEVISAPTLATLLELTGADEVKFRLGAEPLKAILFAPRNIGGDGDDLPAELIAAFSCYAV